MTEYYSNTAFMMSPMYVEEPNGAMHPRQAEDGVDLPATLDAIRSLQEEIEGRKTNVAKLEEWLATEVLGLSKARDLLKTHKQRLARELANLTGDE